MQTICQTSPSRQGNDVAGYSRAAFVYLDFIEQYGIHLCDEENRSFTDEEIANGWAWWNAQPFRDEGLCRDKETGQFFRFTSRVEKRARLNYRVYSITAEVSDMQ